MKHFQNSTVLVLVTVLTIVSDLIGLIGKSTIKNTAYRLFSSSRFASRDYAKLRELKAQLTQLTREKNALSAQDNYAKWTKLNRRLDKLAAQVQAQEKTIAKGKVSVDATIDWLITIGTVVPINLLRAWYSRTPLLYLPNGLIPGFLELFVLNFPFLPRGSVGVIFWSFCVSRVFTTVVNVGKAVFATVPEQPIANKVEEIPQIDPVD